LDSEIKLAKKKNHYVDNKKFLEDIVNYKKRCEDAKTLGNEKPRISEYCGQCVWLITENLAHKPRFMNYSFIDEMKSDALENCFLYFDNFDPNKSSNPFAYFTQISKFAFLRRIGKEEKNRYIIYKKFQENVLETSNEELMVDYDDKHLISTTMYDNLNEFIKNFETRELAKKEKRKLAKEGLEKFVGDEDEGRDTVRCAVSGTDTNNESE
jgi:hypothetical protein